MKTHKTLLLTMMLLALAAAACGVGATGSPTPAAPAAKAIAAPAAQTVDLPSAKAPKASSACEDYFGFCVTAQVSGSVTGAGSSGWGSRSNTDCKAWAGGGAARILELPLMLGAGEQKITVALTRIGAYTGPGTYEMKAQAASGGIPDMLPAIEAAGRTFSNGPDSTAVAVIAADGSGSVQATGLVEQASIQVSNPDPNARVDFAMRWTCQGKK